VFEPVFFAVIIGELFAGRYMFYSAYEYATFGYVCFAIRSTRVVDIAGRVVTWLSIYCFVFAYLEEILAAAAIFLFFRDETAHIFDYACVFFNGFSCEELETCARTLHGKSFWYGRLWRLFRVLW